MIIADQSMYEIIENVKQNGDKALFEYCEKFDRAKLSALEVTATDFFGWIVRKKIIEQPNTLITTRLQRNMEVRSKVLRFRHKINNLIRQ